MREHGRIPLDGQETLRGMLGKSSLQDQRINERLKLILNPRQARVVNLSEHMFREIYAIIRDDNYEPIQANNLQDRGAVFDAAHGYYVAMRMDGLL